MNYLLKLINSDRNQKKETSMKTKDIVIVGMMSAILVCVQVALAFIPNVELVSLLIIIYTLVFGRKTIYIIYVFTLLEGIVFGFGLWWINYLYVWTVLYLIVLLLHKMNSLILWAIVSALYGYGFGALCSIPYFITGGIPSGFAYWIAGIPFDISHGTANFFITLALFKPIYYVLNRINEHMKS